MTTTTTPQLVDVRPAIEPRRILKSGVYVVVALSLSHSLARSRFSSFFTDNIIFLIVVITVLLVLYCKWYMLSFYFILYY